MGTEGLEKMLGQDGKSLKLWIRILSVGLLLKDFILLQPLTYYFIWNLHDFNKNAALGESFTWTAIQYLTLFALLCIDVIMSINLYQGALYGVLNHCKTWIVYGCCIVFLCCIDLVRLILFGGTHVYYGAEVGGCLLLMLAYGWGCVMVRDLVQRMTKLKEGMARTRDLQFIQPLFEMNLFIVGSIMFSGYGVAAAYYYVLISHIM